MTAREQLHYEAQIWSVQDLVNLHRHRQLNLELGFQRDSVWSDRDRAKLVDSVFRNYPIPALFLHRNEEQGELYYDVVEGEQRLETFFRFMGLLRGKRFTVKTVLNDEDGEQIVGWMDLVKRELQHRLTGYSLQIILVEGDGHSTATSWPRTDSSRSPGFTVCKEGQAAHFWRGAAANDLAHQQGSPLCLLR